MYLPVPDSHEKISQLAIECPPPPQTVFGYPLPRPSNREHYALLAGRGACARIRARIFAGDSVASTISNPRALALTGHSRTARLIHSL